MSGLDLVGRRASFSGPHELVNTSDGKILFVWRWDAKKGPYASILIFHGITAYGGVYGPIIAEQLSAAGFDVYGMDLRGHGLSDGRRGDYPSEERLVKDLSETVVHVRGKSRKLILMGHSQGVLPAIVAAKKRTRDVDGLILLSAGRRVRAGVYSKPSTGALLRTLLGVAILHGTPVMEYHREGMVGVDDPLFTFKYSTRFYSVIYGVGALEVSRMLRSGIIDSPNLKFDGKLQVPLFLGVGEHDELFSPESAKELFDEIDCDDKKLVVFPGASHKIFPRDGWVPLLAWLDERFRAGQAPGP
jgi:acylglycerol lipase